jgi:hypothetical protein
MVQSAGAEEYPVPHPALCLSWQPSQHGHSHSGIKHLTLLYPQIVKGCWVLCFLLKRRLLMCLVSVVCNAFE